MPRNTRICQKPGRFLRLRRARRRAIVRHVFFVALGPTYLDKKSRTGDVLEMPKMAAQVATRPAMVVSRVAADIVEYVYVKKRVCSRDEPHMKAPGRDFLRLGSDNSNSDNSHI